MHLAGSQEQQVLLRLAAGLQAAGVQAGSAPQRVEQPVPLPGVDAVRALSPPHLTEPAHLVQHPSGGGAPAPVRAVAEVPQRLQPDRHQQPERRQVGGCVGAEPAGERAVDAGGAEREVGGGTERGERRVQRRHLVVEQRRIVGVSPLQCRHGSSRAMLRRSTGLLHRQARGERRHREGTTRRGRRGGGGGQAESRAGGHRHLGHLARLLLLACLRTLVVLLLLQRLGVE